MIACHVIPSRSARRPTALPFALAALALMSAACPPTPVGPSQPTNYNKDFRLPFPTTATAPSMDGDYQTGGVLDPGWSSASMVDLDGGAAVNAALMRVTSDATSMYFYFEVEDILASTFDALVIGVNASGGNNDYHRLIIYPCTDALGGATQCGATGRNLTPMMEYADGQRAGSTWTWTTASSLPAGMGAKVSVAVASVTDLRWSVEVQMPRGAPLNIVANSFFGLYVDLVNVTDASRALSLADEFSWPPGVEVNGVIGTHTPDPATWGNGILGAAWGNGVYISGSDITTNHGPGTISLNQPNVFSVNAHNNLVSAGTFQTAKNVRATFKIANFGLPAASSWALVPPATGNPTARADIVPTGSRQFSSGSWTLDPTTEVPVYTANDHQCIRVDLDSTDPNTLFWNPSAQANMDFVVTHSPFHRVAHVANRGYKPALATTGEVVMYFDEVMYNVNPELRWSSSIKGVSRTVDKLGPHRYRVTAAPDNDIDLDINIDPPQMEAVRETARVPAGTTGRGSGGLRMPVEPGGLITIYAEGNVTTGGGPSPGPGPGPGRGETTGGGVAPARSLMAAVIDPKSLVPDAPIGLLVGSWNNFETAFPVGTAASLKVPENAREILLAINDTPEGYARQGGEGFTVSVARSPLRPYHLYGNSILANKSQRADFAAPLGANLPSWYLRGKVQTDRTVQIKGQTFTVCKPIGSFGYLVRDM